MNNIIGEIRLYAGNRIPSYWYPCDGRVVSGGDARYLENLIGDTFGYSQNSTSVQLPDLRGRLPVGVGFSRRDGFLIASELGDRVGSAKIPVSTTTMSGGSTVRVRTLAPTQSNVQPSLGLNYIICAHGRWPQFDDQRSDADAEVVGQIRIWPIARMRSNWLVCAGQTLRISENPLLFFVIGTTYGQDGEGTFKLPDFRSRVPVGSGDGPFQLGRTFGRDSLPTSPRNVTPGGTPGKPTVFLDSFVMGDERKVQPSLGIHFAICVQGQFPRLQKE